MSSRRERSGGSITAPGDSCDSSAASKRPSAARLPSGSALVATSTMLCLSSFGSRNARPFCSAARILPDLRAVEHAFARFLDQRERIVREARTVAEHHERCAGKLQRARRDIVPGARLAEDQHRPPRGDQRLERLFGLANRRPGAEGCERYATRLLRRRRLQARARSSSAASTGRSAFRGNRTRRCWSPRRPSRSCRGRTS